MYVIEYWGECLTQEKIVPGNTATSPSANCYEYKEFTLQCDGVDAGSIEPTKQNWIVGGTSNARGVIVDYSLDSGAWGNANARVTLTLRCVTGTWTATENIGYGSEANWLTVRTGFTQVPRSGNYENQGRLARAAMFQVFDNTVLVCYDKSIPNQTALVGNEILAGQYLLLKDINSIKNAKFIDYVSGSASRILATYYF